jgi:hypothetical protein
MKRFALAALLGLVLAWSAIPAVAAPDAYDETQSHPLRVVAYLIYPVGYGLEWLVFRPFHYLVSRPALEPVFGHRPHEQVGGYQ